MRVSRLFGKTLRQDSVEAEIVALVYDLYGLTEAERRLVEGGITEP